VRKPLKLPFAVAEAPAASGAGPASGNWTPMGSLTPSSQASLALLAECEGRRASSYDRRGGNADYFSELKVGEPVTLADIAGPGMITHIWIPFGRSGLKEIVLRAYWDAEREPSIETPLGDFFGLGLGEVFTYQSALTSIAPWNGLNCYFPMPFEKAARLTVTNEGRAPVNRLFFHIDYFLFKEPLEGVGYFHAQYRQQAPCHGWTDDWKSNYEPQIDGKKNPDGKGNYVFLEAEGRGHFLGLTQAVLQNQDDWYGEGDEMIFVDGSELPVIIGTGTEDYFNGSWDYRGPNGTPQPYSYLSIGTPYIANGEKIGGRYCSYRWHLEGPIPFSRSIKVTIEHGHANHRSDNFYTVAYWYQTEPHAKFPELPKVEDRIPRVYAVGGPRATQRSR